MTSIQNFFEIAYKHCPIAYSRLKLMEIEAYLVRSIVWRYE